jgi:hypothetical protein
LLRSAASHACKKDQQIADGAGFEVVIRAATTQARRMRCKRRVPLLIGQSDDGGVAQ